MANLIKTRETELKCDEVIARVVQFFSNEKWRCQSQSEKIATFQGRPPMPWFLILLTLIAFCFFVIPGIIMYFFVVRKVRRFQNLVVTTRAIPGGSDVDINYPKHAKKLVNRFLGSLPPHRSESVPFEAATQPA